MLLRGKDLWCPEGEELKYFEISIKGSPEEGACCDLIAKKSFSFWDLPHVINPMKFLTGSGGFLPFSYRAAPPGLLKAGGPPRPPFMLKAGKSKAPDADTPVAAAECVFKDPSVKVDPIPDYM